MKLLFIAISLKRKQMNRFLTLKRIVWCHVGLLFVPVLRKVPTRVSTSTN